MAGDGGQQSDVIAVGYDPHARRRGWLASALLSFSVLGLAAGCINPIWQLEPLDPDVNHPPFLLNDRNSPPLGVDPIDADIGDNCAHETFRATPVDLDGDILSFKWLLVGRLGLENEGTVRTRQVKVGTLTPSDASLDEVLPGSAEENPDGAWYQGLEFEMRKENLTGGFDNPSSLAGADKTHLLSVYVSDRTFGQDPLNTTPLVGEGEAAQPVATASWQIRILESDCPQVTP